MSFINVIHAVPPSPLRNLRLVTTKDDLIIVTWDSPARRGSHDLTYGVYVSRNSQNRRKIQQVNETIVTISGKLSQHYIYNI